MAYLLILVIIIFFVYLIIKSKKKTTNSKLVKSDEITSKPYEPSENTENFSEKYKSLNDLKKLPNFNAGIEIRKMYSNDEFDRYFYDILKEQTKETKYDSITIKVIKNSDPFELIKHFSEWKYNKVFFSNEVYKAIKNQLNSVNFQINDLDKLYNYFRMVKSYKFYFFDEAYSGIIKQINKLQEEKFIPATYSLSPGKASVFLNSKKKDYTFCFSQKLDKAIIDLKNLDGFESLQKQKAGISSKISKAKKRNDSDKILILQEQQQILNEEISELIKNYFLYL